MSLLWRDELRVVLCPDKVIILGLGKGLHYTIRHEVIFTCSSEPGEVPWRQAIAALAQWLQGNEVGRARATVILSNHFVRYALMPFSPEVTNLVEEHELAQAVVGNIYGDVAQKWKLVISDGGYNEARLIAAMDIELLEAITHVFAQASVRLVAVKPYLTSVFNACRKQIPGSGGMIAVAEPGQLLAVVAKENKLLSVRRVALSGDLVEQLPKLLQREVMLSGLEEADASIYLRVAGSPDFKLHTDIGVPVHALQYPGKGRAVILSDKRFDMASAG